MVKNPSLDHLQTKVGRQPGRYTQHPNLAQNYKSRYRLHFHLAQAAYRLISVQKGSSNSSRLLFRAKLVDLDKYKITYINHPPPVTSVLKVNQGPRLLGIKKNVTAMHITVANAVIGGLSGGACLHFASSGSRFRLDKQSHPDGR
jgi:hypothetical protein